MAERIGYQRTQGASILRMMAEAKRDCAHTHVRKQIGHGADGKTYCADCGVERPAFSYLDLMGDGSLKERDND